MDGIEKTVMGRWRILVKPKSLPGQTRPSRGCKNCPSFHCSWLWSLHSTGTSLFSNDHI